MSCINDFITLRGAGVTPTSGLYINDLYGVNIAKIDGVASNDYDSLPEYVTRKIYFAISLVSIELKRYVMPYFKLNSVVGHYLGGKFDEDLEYHDAEVADKGIVIEITETTLSQIIINRVTVLADSTGDFDLTITDGLETEVTAVTLAAGEEQDVELDYYCNRKKVYITMNNIAGAKGDAGMDCQGDYDILSVKGWTGSLTSSSHFGIRADVTVICNPVDLFCLMKDFLALATLYRFGIDLANESLETDRFNYFSMVTRDDLLNLRDRYQEDYDKEMEQIARTMPILLRKLDPYCIICNQDKYVEHTP